MALLDDVLESAALLQQKVPDAILVGGTVAAYYAHHRESYDHDHVLKDLKSRYSVVLEALETLDNWERSPRSRPPMTILGLLGDIPAGVRNLRREVPLEIEEIELPSGHHVTISTIEEALRIKAFLLVNRNFDRDYVDVVALSDQLGVDAAANVLLNIDSYYPEFNGAVGDQLLEKLSCPQPEPNPRHDLYETRNLSSKYSSEYVSHACRGLAERMM